jgi:cyclohexadienyl dehydratase
MRFGSGENLRDTAMLRAMLLAAALLLGCRGAEFERSAPAPAPAPPTRPVLRIGTSGDYPPFSKAGSGFDIEVGKRLAEALDHDVEWVPFAWPDLKAKIAANAFDVAMSGVTLRPDRSLIGYMTRAVASGGPCVLGQAEPKRVAVNRGGILERWARERLRAVQLRTVDDNLALPVLLERGEVDAIVTDSFELAHFARPGWRTVCEPARDRKVYWVSPGRVAELAPRIDAWLSSREPRLRKLRAQWLGEAPGWKDVDHLVDLLARRLALMPAVAAYKKERELPIEDAAREAVVLAQTIDSAAAAGLEQDSVRALFVELIALAKAVQQRNSDAQPLDLESVLRPALSSLGERILVALVACANELPQLRLEQLDLLVPLIDEGERRRLLQALRAVRTSPR